MVLFNLQRYRSGVLHISTRRSDNDRVVLLSLRNDATAASHHDSPQRASEQQQ